MELTHNNKTRIIFIGTAEFGLPVFKALAADRDFEIILTVTQPDKPSGRGRALNSPPIKLAAEELGLTVLQPERIGEIRGKIALLKPDLIMVIAYGQLIPPEILSLPRFGCLNLHASLLPKYRGAAVIQAAILNRDRETGLSLMKLDQGLDTGPVIDQLKISINDYDTAGGLYDRLAELSPDFTLTAVKRYLAGAIKPRPQAGAGASYAKTLAKTDGLINWSKPAEELERFIRAMNPWPMAWTWLDGRQVKIISAQKQPIEINSYKPGKTFKYNAGLAVQCGRDALIIKSLQLEGKNALPSADFLRGQKDFIGNILG